MTISWACCSEQAPPSTLHLFSSECLGSLRSLPLIQHFYGSTFVWLRVPCIAAPRGPWLSSLSLSTGIWRIWMSFSRFWPERGPSILLLPSLHLLCPSTAPEAVSWAPWAASDPLTTGHPCGLICLRTQAHRASLELRHIPVWWVIWVFGVAKSPGQHGYR